MNSKNVPMHIFNTHAEAESAIRALNHAGFDMSKLSLVGKGYHSEEHPLGFYTVADRIKSWGGMGAFWGGIWGVLLAPAVFFLPGVGLVAMAGPFAMALVAALEGAVALGGVPALGAALVELGLPKEQAIKYEAALKVDQYVLIVHGDAGEQAKADVVLVAAANEDMMDSPVAQAL